MKKDNKLTVLEDPNKDNDNIINFSEARKGLITGGPPGDENWLKLLSVGTVFLCKRKTDPKEKSFLDLFCVLEHKVMSSNLMQKLPNGQQIDLWFPTLNFSRDNTFNEVIAEVKVGYDEAPVEEQDKTPEITDGNSSRSV